MAQSFTQAVLDEAISWHLRLRAGGAEDWQAFTQWLEGGPQHADAYDAVEAGHVAMTAEAFPQSPPAAANDDTDVAASARSRRWWPIAAIAAVLLLVVVLAPMLLTRSAPYEVVTGAGEKRTLALADGGAIMLNGSTRLVLDHNNARLVVLKQGEAVFKVKHDPDRPFIVTSGSNRIQDSGTVFNVISDGPTFGVEVAEGSVVYDPDRLAIPLTAGQTLSVADAGPPRLGRTDPGAVGGWRQGQLAYTDAPASRVAGDISRTLGVAVKLDPKIVDMPFTGSIRLSGDPAAALTTFAASVGLKASRTPDGWLIEPESRALH